MDEPRRNRLPLLVAAGAVIALIAIVAVTGRETTEKAPPPAPEPKGEEVAVAPPRAAPLLPPPPLRRGDLVAAAARAAAAYAAGAGDPTDDKTLTGQRFEVVIPFGCQGPSATAGGDPARWTFDLVKKSITLSAQPQIWTQTPWVREIVGPGEFELIEGFWIPRPWLASETCPPPRMAAPGAPAPTPSQSTVGLVRIAGPEEARSGRRADRPYQVVRKASEAELATSAREYRLVLSGRLAGFPGGAPIRCHAASIDQRPVCLIGVAIDRVAFVDPESDEVLAEWTR